MKRIQNFCQEIPGLERIAGQASALQQLARISRNAVPEAMRAHIIACAVRDATLVVFTDTGAWGSQLRFLQPLILDALEKEAGISLSSVRFKVQPSEIGRMDTTSAASKRPASDHAISSQSRRFIQCAADGINDPELAAALRRLARESGQGD